MKIRPLFTIILFSLIGLGINKLIFYFFVPETYGESLVYPLPLLHAFFGIFSVIIIAVLHKIRQKNINNVGYTFLLLTSLKMVLAYLFLRPVLALDLPQTPTEKMNFFIVFLYFLAVETIVTIRILNDK